MFGVIPGLTTGVMGIYPSHTLMFSFHLLTGIQYHWFHYSDGLLFRLAFIGCGFGLKPGPTTGAISDYPSHVQMI